MIVLDTHVLIWTVQDDPKLGEKARRVVESAAVNDNILIPAICVWEIALLVSRGQIELAHDPLGWMRRVLNRPGYSMAALEPDIAIGSVALDWSHKDPADRMIVATAQHWRVPVLTADHTILTYSRAGHVQAIDARR